MTNDTDLTDFVNFDGTGMAVAVWFTNHSQEGLVLTAYKLASDGTIVREHYDVDGNLTSHNTMPESEIKSVKEADVLHPALLLGQEYIDVKKAYSTQPSRQVKTREVAF